MDSDVAPPAPRAKPDRALVVILGIIAAVAIAAIVVVVVRGATPQTFDPESPEFVVQAYAQAVIDGDAATALSLIDHNSSPCSDFRPHSDSEDMRVAIGESRVTGTTAMIDVIMTRSSNNGPFMSGEYSSEGTFSLQQWENAWRIQSSPYELHICDN